MKTPFHRFSVCLVNYFGHIFDCYVSSLVLGSDVARRGGRVPSPAPVSIYFGVFS